MKQTTQIKALVSCCLALIFLGLPHLLSAQAPTGVTVAGIDVTSLNAQDVLHALGADKGTVSYNINERILTLRDVHIELSGGTNMIKVSNSLSSFTILLEGNNYLSSDYGRIDLAAPNCTITGKGSLTVKSGKGAAIFLDDSALSITNGATVDATGAWGVSGFMGLCETLTVDSATLKASGPQGSIYGFKQITLNRCQITRPQGATIEGGVIAYNNKLCREQVVIEPVSTDYHISVQGVQVTPENASDILQDGTVSYSADTKSLLLKGAKLKAIDQPAIETLSPTYILIEGENQISSTTVDALSLQAPVEIIGKGSLKITTTEGSAIKSTSSLTIKEATITTMGAKGIVGSQDNETHSNQLSIIDSKLLISGVSSTIIGFDAIQMRGCHIHRPRTVEIEGGSVMQDGKPYAGELLIDLTQNYLFVGGVYATSENYADVLGDGTVSYDIESRTLTLDNFTFKATTAVCGVNIMTALSDATIVLKGDNCIETPYFGVIISAPTTIRGDGRLTVQSKSSAVVLNTAPLTVESGKLFVTSEEGGIVGFPKSPGSLTVKGGELSVQGDKGSIYNCTQLELQGVSITDPIGATVEGDKIVYKGELCTERVIIKKSNDNKVATPLERSPYQVYTTPEMLHIEGLKQETTIQVYRLDGVRMWFGTTVGTLQIPLPHGTYLLAIDEQVSKICL